MAGETQGTRPRGAEGFDLCKQHADADRSMICVELHVSSITWWVDCKEEAADPH